MKLARMSTILSVLLVLTTALAGCHGLDEGGDQDPDPSPSPSPTGNATASPTPTTTATPTPTETPEPGPNFEIEIADAPGSVTQGDTVTIQVNVTGENFTASVADLYYGFNSTLPIGADNLTTEDFNGSADGNGNLTFPGTYAIVNWTIEDNRTLFVRAHVVHDGVDHWSDEVVITVNEPDADPPVGQTRTIRIDTRPTAAPCEFANYAGPNGNNGGLGNENKTIIKVNEAVVFVSQETAANCVHTATSTADPPVFDTGDIQNDETSEAIVFRTPGLYTFYCEYHPLTMRGEIEVVA